MAGCLLPPPSGEIPVPINQPPRIERNNLSPNPTLGAFSMSTQCTEYHFFFSLSDPDGDTLYWRVFLDYTNDFRALESEPTEYQPTGQRDILSFTVDPRDFVGPLAEPHTVELLVSDRPFSEQPREPFGRVIDDDDGRIDSVIWAVKLSNDPVQQCFGGGIGP